MLYSMLEAHSKTEGELGESNLEEVGLNVATINSQSMKSSCQKRLYNFCCCSDSNPDRPGDGETSYRLDYTQ